MENLDKKLDFSNYEELLEDFEKYYGNDAKIHLDMYLKYMQHEDTCDHKIISLELIDIDKI